MIVLLKYICGHWTNVFLLGHKYVMKFIYNCRKVHSFPLLDVNKIQSGMGARISLVWENAHIRMLIVLSCYGSIPDT